MSSSHKLPFLATRYCEFGVAMFEESLSRVAYWQGASPRPPATNVYGSCSSILPPICLILTFAALFLKPVIKRCYRELPGVRISLEGAIASMVSLLAWDCRLPMGKPKWREVRAEAGVADDPGEFERTSCSIRGAQACRVLLFGGTSTSMSTSISYLDI